MTKSQTKSWFNSSSSHCKFTWRTGATLLTTCLCLKAFHNLKSQPCQSRTNPQSAAVIFRQAKTLQERELLGGQIRLLNKMLNQSLSTKALLKEFQDTSKRDKMSTAPSLTQWLRTKTSLWQSMGVIGKSWPVTIRIRSESCSLPGQEVRPAIGLVNFTKFLSTDRLRTIFRSWVRLVWA